MYFLMISNSFKCFDGKIKYQVFYNIILRTCIICYDFQIASSLLYLVSFHLFICISENIVLIDVFFTPRRNPRNK